MAQKNNRTEEFNNNSGKIQISCCTNIVDKQHTGGFFCISLIILVCFCYLLWSMPVARVRLIAVIISDWFVMFLLAKSLIFFNAAPKKYHISFAPSIIWRLVCSYSREGSFVGPVILFQIKGPFCSCISNTITFTLVLVSFNENK